VRNGRFSFSFRSAMGSGELVSGRDFRIDDAGLCESLLSILSPRLEDLVHIAMAVYVADRLSKRNARLVWQGPARDIDLAVQVLDPEFWRSEPVRKAIIDVVDFVSGDRWNVEFVPAEGDTKPEVSPFLSSLWPEPPIVCLYSGGLDSAAGLATRLRASDGGVLAVTAHHQPGQKTRVRSQLRALGDHYHRQIDCVLTRTTLVHAPRASLQELTQRCRPFLFAALGGVAAAASGAPAVEVYENGIGAMNVPAMTGMLTAGRSTRGCHPAFMRQMSLLVSTIAGRSIEYRLPCQTLTKAQVVATLAQDGLSGLAENTVSCVHYPRRVPGPEKSCGVCAACIQRRQALVSAGVLEAPSRYQYDVFGGPSAITGIPMGELLPLKAELLHATDVYPNTSSDSIPARVLSHLVGTGIATDGGSLQACVDLLGRYATEWEELLGQYPSLSTAVLAGGPN
jgi:7-cyano-7-deazaguanine synthase in queuosine biosynthesis